MSFENALDAEISALQADLDADPRSIKLQELKRVRALYRPLPSNVTMTTKSRFPSGTHMHDGIDLLTGTHTGIHTMAHSARSLTYPGHMQEGAYASAAAIAMGVATSLTDGRSGRKPSPTRIQALLIAKEFIRGKSEPTKTSDIWAKIKDAGVFIGGNDPQNNLSAMLHNSDEFKSHGRAGWTLV